MRKKINSGFRKEKEKAQQYLNIAGVMFVALDRNGIVTLVNRKACEILGYDPLYLLSYAKLVQAWETDGESITPGGFNRII